MWVRTEVQIIGSNRGSHVLGHYSDDFLISIAYHKPRQCANVRRLS